MKVVGLPLLREFQNRHADVRSQINAWISEVEEAQWNSPQDIKARYSSASFLANNQVVFNLKGNDYRLVVKVSYKAQLVLIKKIGTHAEYSRWKL
ncbi:MAG: type II toxin-antitoxin system HigB family toxin [bacterium]|nr:type II toxin-antitoxin system HigB family toxin [bacterium]